MRQGPQWSHTPEAGRPPIRRSAACRASATLKRQRTSILASDALEKGGNFGLRGRFDAVARGALTLQVHGKLDIDLEALLQGVAGAELTELKALFILRGVHETCQAVLEGRRFGNKAFVKEVKGLLKEEVPTRPQGRDRHGLFCASRTWRPWRWAPRLEEAVP